MPHDFTPEPGEIEPKRSERRRPVRLVSTGLAPTAAVPTPTRRTPDDPPCYAPCTDCGVLVLAGATEAGIRLALDVRINTYVVDWTKGTAAPVFIESRGYPVHRCPCPVTEEA
jgi:hypothetical protein